MNNRNQLSYLLIYQNKSEDTQRTTKLIADLMDSPENRVKLCQAITSPILIETNKIKS